MSAATAWKRAPVSMFMATCGGVGHLPGGPGTYAAALALPSIYVLSHRLAIWQHIALVAAVGAVSVYWCDRAGKALEEEDSRRIVLDEWVGVWVALAPFANLTVAHCITGFVAFRLFDVWKPLGIRRIDERVHGGLGVMLDDVAAGVVAAVCVGAARWAGL